MAYNTVDLKNIALRRLDVLKRFMEEYRVSALILFEGDGIAYKFSLTQHFNIVLVAPSEIYVFADIALYDEALNESPWEVVLVENFTLSRLAEKIVSVVEGEGSRIRLGVNKMWGRGKLTFLYMDLLHVLQSRGIEIIDATHVLTEVFSKPYNEEIPVIDWISQVASKALETVYEYLKPGMRECKLASLVDKVLDENGIIDRWFPTIVASGPRTATPHARTSTRRIGYGEPVIVDIGPFWMGYDGCIAHTFVAGRNKYWEEIIEKVKQAVHLGLEHVKPGTPVKTLDEIPRRELRRQGLPDYPHLTGHPVGGFYKPVIAGFIDYTLEANMVFAYEPSTYIQGKGGVRIEPHILVTSHGYKILTEFHENTLTST